MKKLLTIALALMLVLCLCACNQTPTEEPVVTETEFTFPAGTTILNVDISGLNQEAARTAVQNAVINHTMTVTVDGQQAAISGAEIGLTLSQERYDAIATALEAGAPVEMDGLLTFNEGKLRALMNQHFNKPVTEAAIVFDEASGDYVLVEDAPGQISNPNALVSALREGILNLNAAPVVADLSQIVEPTAHAEDSAIQEALALANKMNDVALVYTFTAEGKTSTHTITKEDIRSFISLGRENLTPEVNHTAIENYVAQLSDNYSAGNTTGSFKTTGGGTVGLTVTYNGVYVDQPALVEDIVDCLTEGVSGTRTAPYKAATIRDMPYGGTYIEVNLSAQRLWFYKNGECILNSSFVSGKVSAGWNTPNGVFAIYAKDASTYLVGEDYRSFVNYWMPFYGGYGLHDATWRSSFGGEIYLYGGSHGCVNLPLSSAATIFNNAPVGTKVIVYGGRTSVPPQPQSLSGTTSYAVAEDAEAFTLNIKPRFSDPPMTYSSSDSGVASVSSSGVITINGVGTAVITVSVPSYEGYTSANTKVTITVRSLCDDGRHPTGDPQIITQPTCQPGLKKVSCTKCSYTSEIPMDPVADHVFTTYTQDKAPTCNADGTEVSTCDTCHKATDTKPITNRPDHTPGSPVTTLEPNCTNKGKTETRCTVCNTVTATDDLDPVAGKHEAGAPVVTDATCTADGKKETFCKHCNELLNTEVLPMGHKYGDWQTTTPAGCTTGGVQTRTCSGCGHTETRDTDPAGHSYGNWTTVTPATCTSGGTESRTCSKCNNVETRNTGSNGHSFSSGTCSNCGAADPNASSGSEG